MVGTTGSGSSKGRADRTDTGCQSMAKEGELLSEGIGPGDTNSDEKEGKLRPTGMSRDITEGRAQCDG